MRDMERKEGVSRLIGSGSGSVGDFDPAGANKGCAVVCAVFKNRERLLVLSNGNVAWFLREKELFKSWKSECQIRKLPLQNKSDTMSPVGNSKP